MSKFLLFSITAISFLLMVHKFINFIINIHLCIFFLSQKLLHKIYNIYIPYSAFKVQTLSMSFIGGFHVLN